MTNTGQTGRLDFDREGSSVFWDERGMSIKATGSSLLDIATFLGDDPQSGTAGAVKYTSYNIVTKCKRQSAVGTALLA